MVVQTLIHYVTFSKSTVPAPTISVVKDYTPYNGTKFNITCTVEVDVAVDTGITIDSEWVLPQHVNNSGTISNISKTETKLKQSRTLIFRPLRGEDNGTYTCRARVQPKPDDKNILKVSANETTDVTVQGTGSRGAQSDTHVLSLSLLVQVFQSPLSGLPSAPPLAQGPSNVWVWTSAANRLTISPAWLVSPIVY